MHRFHELSLRTQLLILAILLILPSLGIIIFNGYKQHNDDLQQTAVETQKLADNIAAEQERIAHDARQLGQLLSQLPEVKQPDKSKVQSILANILKDNPQYLSLLIADRSGNVWASATPLKQPVSIADRRYFKNALASKRFSSGEYTIGKVSGKPTLAMGYPFLDGQGEVEGLVVLSINPERLRPLLERSQLPTDTNYVVADHKGIIISRGQDAVKLAGTPLQPDAFKSMQGSPDKGTYEFVRKDGDNRITSYRKLWLSGEKSPYLYIRADISYKTAAANTYREVLYNSAVLVPFVIIAFVLVFYIGKRSISDRVAILDSAAKQLAMGSLPVKVADLVKGGELGSLGETFDNMAQQLKTREQALQKSESHYRAMIDAFDGFIYICSSDHRIEFMNEALKKRSGYDATGEPCHKVLHELDSICPWCINDRVAAGENVQWEVKSPKDDRWYQVSNTPIYYENEIVSKQAMITDITERKEAEQALVDKTQMLAEMNNNLEQLVNKAVNDLRQKDLMLIQQSRLATMGEMINNIAHQWRQPLNNIGLIVQNLQEDFETGQLTQEVMATDAKLAMETILYMSRTIDDFRNFFRQDKHKQDFILSELLNRTLEFISIGFKNRNITIDIETLDEVTAHGYPNEFMQAMLNILNNAKDVLVDRKVVAPCVRIKVFKENERAVMTIGDNAGGIPQEIFPRIFDPYFSTKETGKGTGIGLYMSKVIIEQNMGGSLTACNVNSGAEFRIEV